MWYSQAKALWGPRSLLRILRLLRPRTWRTTVLRVKSFLVALSCMFQQILNPAHVLKSLCQKTREWPALARGARVPREKGSCPTAPPYTGPGPHANADRACRSFPLGVSSGTQTITGEATALGPPREGSVIWKATSSYGARFYRQYYTSPGTGIASPPLKTKIQTFHQLDFHQNNDL